MNVRRVLIAPTDFPLCLLDRMAALGFASKCGRLFHVTPACDRAAEMLREPQGELFA